MRSLSTISQDYLTFNSIDKDPFKDEDNISVADDLLNSVHVPHSKSVFKKQWADKALRAI
jgi:hypothetical protein